ncbi:MAG: putative transposase [Candidatus Promineifilaceae bacterium]|jgi:putative transposase
MNIKEIQVQNAANLSVNLSLFMVNVSQVLAADHADQKRHMSVLDLKALYHGRKYVREVLKFLPQLPQPFLIDALFARVAVLGSINHT